MAELGGGGYVSRDILSLTERGIDRMLACIGMLPEYKADRSIGTKELTVVETLVTHQAGLFEPHCNVEDMVKCSDPAGTIHFPEDPWKKPTELQFSQKRHGSVQTGAEAYRPGRLSVSGRPGPASQSGGRLVQ